MRKLDTIVFMRKWNWALAGWCAGVFLLAAVLLAGAWWIWGEWLDLADHPGERAASALATLGGLGGAVFLTVKYRSQSLVERTERRELADASEKQLVAAVQMLGDSSASTRIAGVCALADVADTHGGNYRQRVVDILCGYLRTRRVLSRAQDASWQDRRETEVSRSGSLDGPVESSIMHVFRRHLRRGSHSDMESFDQEVADELLWCACFFDLHDTTFTEPLELSGARFEGGASFRGSEICEHNMEGAWFGGRADFREAKFYRMAQFGFTKFHWADFTAATFSDHAQFQRSTFTHGQPTFAEVDFAFIPVFMNAEFAATPWFGDVNVPQSEGIDVDLIFRDAKFNVACLIGPSMIALPWVDSSDPTTGLPSGSRWGIFDEGGAFVRDATREEVAAAQTEAAA